MTQRNVLVCLMATWLAIVALAVLLVKYVQTEFALDHQIQMLCCDSGGALPSGDSAEHEPLFRDTNDDESRIDRGWDWVGTSAPTLQRRVGS